MLRTSEEQFSRRTSGQVRGEGSRQPRVLYSDPYTTSEDRLYCGAIVVVVVVVVYQFGVVGCSDYSFYVDKYVNFDIKEILKNF